MSIDKTAIRDAATVIVLRDRDTAPRVLMGQRGAKAAFMPNKFVFPGGAVDAADAEVPLTRPLTPLCRARLEDDAPSGVADALAPGERVVVVGAGLIGSGPLGPAT